MLALDLHAAQIQGFFDIPVDHLHAGPVINDYIRSLNIPQRDFVVLSPDEGSIKRALLHQKKLGGAIAIVDKRRSSATETKQANLIGGSLEDKVAVIFDDMISTAGSVVGAANVASYNGAREVYACATHAVLCGPAIERLRDAPDQADRRDRQHPAAAEQAAAEHQGPERGAAAGRRHQAHSLQRVGQQAVRINRCANNMTVQPTSLKRPRRTTRSFAGAQACFAEEVRVPSLALQACFAEEGYC